MRRRAWSYDRPPNPLDLGARPNRNRPPRRRWSPGTGNRAVRGYPVPAPPKRESMRLAAQRLWVGLRLARQARPASNQERSPLAGMSSTGKRAHLYT
ncbi:hypothetical protein SEA_GANDALF20_5 [Mycobacterium phage Gandalf20]|nr:hypothetical protein SEA_GANDALF20_5 [Mycobacterium phage Gandalf20]